MSSFSTALTPFTLDADYFEALPCHRDETALLVTREEGDALAQTLGPHFAVLMANHGVTFCGTSIPHATCVGVFLERAARIQFEGGKMAGAEFPSDAVRAKRRSQIMTPVHVEHSWNYFVRKLAWTARVQGCAELYS